MPSKKDLSTKIVAIEKSQQKLNIERDLLLKKAIESDNPDDIMKANEMLEKLYGEGKHKSYLVDPNEFLQNFEYKDKPTSLSYDMLRAMSKTSIINAIHRTRINQGASFAQPVVDRYALGYEIRKKSYLPSSEPSKLTTQERKEIEKLIQFLEDGVVYNERSIWSEHDDFDTFTRKYLKDSLSFDQATFEVVRTRNGKLHEYFATDASTFRLAATYADENYRGKKKEEIAGHLPAYVQIFHGKVVEEYYPWELCFGVRNVVTDVRLNGYGISELEDLISVVTSMLWGEDYNRRFFKQGSAPKGILKVSGNVNEAKLREFKQQWKAQMSGVANAFKTPIIEADKMDWVDLQRSNRDMEYSNWFEFLIKVACAIYLIDPAEVNFPFNGSPNQQFLFQGDNSERVQFSRDKGLSPLMKAFSKKINKFLISPYCVSNLNIEPKYELVYKGIDSSSPKDELEMDVKLVSNLDTLNEVRARRGAKPLPFGDMPLNPIYFQQMMTANQSQEGNGMEGQEEQEGQEGQEVSQNPFEKALKSYFKSL